MNGIAITGLAAVVLLVAEPVTKIAPLVADTLALARAWQRDAVVTGVFIKARGDGKIDPKRLLGPTDPHGGYVAVYVHSPAASLMRIYGLADTGRVVEQGPPLPGPPDAVALPARFLDLDLALEKARARGLGAPPDDGKSFLDAKLVAVKGTHGKPDGAMWTFVAVDMSGAFPVPGGQITLDAASGAETTEDGLSGRKDRQRLLEDVRRGRTHPATRRDWAFYKKEADDLARRLDAASAFRGVELAATLKTGFSLERATFLYGAPAANPSGGATLTSVGMFETPDGMLIRVEEVERPLAPPDIAPRGVPDDVMAPADAARRLLEVDPKIPADPIVMTLVCGDALAHGIRVESERRARPMEPATAVLVDAMGGRFFWFARGSRLTRNTIAAFLVCGVADLEEVAIDAVSGVPFVRRGVAPSSRPAGVRGVDPALLGAWSAEVDGAKVTMEFLVAGEVRVRARFAGRDIDQRGKLDAVGGRWEIEMQDGGTFAGSYRFVDRDTLEWVDPKDRGPTVLRRVAPR